VRERWFDFPRTLWLMLLPAACLAARARLWILTGRLKQGGKTPEWAPYAYAAAIFTLAFAGLAWSMFPWLVLDKIAICETAHPSALWVIFWGAIVVLPFILAYNVLAYRIFKGKAKEHLY